MLGIASSRNRLLTALIHSDRDGSNPLTPRLHGPEKQKGQLRKVGLSACFIWLREQDSNLRPSGYEPDELPDCSTPRLKSVLRCVSCRGVNYKPIHPARQYFQLKNFKRPPNRPFILFNRCRPQTHKPSTKARYIDIVVGSIAKATLLCLLVELPFDRACETTLCILTGVAICSRLPAWAERRCLFS